MEQKINSIAGRQQADKVQVRDAEDVAANLLLREVKAFLRDGQPRHAVAHIIDTTGVSRNQASEFIAELQGGVFTK